GEVDVARADSAAPGGIGELHVADELREIARRRRGINPVRRQVVCVEQQTNIRHILEVRLQELCDVVAGVEWIEGIAFGYEWFQEEYSAEGAHPFARPAVAVGGDSEKFIAIGVRRDEIPNRHVEQPRAGATMHLRDALT